MVARLAHLRPSEPGDAALAAGVGELAARSCRAVAARSPYRFLVAMTKRRSRSPKPSGE